MIANINSCFKCFRLKLGHLRKSHKVISLEEANKIEERKKSAAKIARECFDLDESVYINGSQWPLPTRS